MAGLLSLSEHVARLKVLALIAEYRFQGGRISYFAILYAHGRTDEEREHYRRVIDVAKARADLARAALVETGPIEGHCAGAIEWARGHVRATPGFVERVHAFHAVLEESLHRAKAERDTLIDYLLDTTQAAAALFGDTYLALLKTLEEELERADRLRAEQSQGATEEARRAMGHIHSVSRSVRLISLNAAVEAARVGDAGRGFSVIASEIKTLAEAIAGASGDAERSMDKLNGLAGGDGSG
ncbi:MAG: methyl-accepting chemotaxis protein [Pseudomonadota bacterium]